MRNSDKTSTIAFDRPFSQSFTWLEPKDGLAIDAETWRVAHGYHDHIARGHNLGAHGPGILVGLSVVPVGGTEVGVTPGVGIDPIGRFLVVQTPQRVRIEAKNYAEGTAFLVLLPLPIKPNDQGRAKEETVVQVVGSLPAEPHLELARITMTSKSEVGSPENPFDPRAGEIDLRYRLTAGGSARGDVAVAEIAFGDAGDAHAGVAALIARAVNDDGAYRARFIGKIQPGDSLPESTILYSTGDSEFTVSTGVSNWLKSFLDGGGTLIGDGCHATPADPFGGAFDKLARGVGRQLRRVMASDRLLVSHHVFGAPPAGLAKADAGLALAGGGIYYLASDFGCILAGASDPPPPRHAIKASEEFATNLAAIAHERATGASFLE